MILEKLGEGGFGNVYKGVDVMLQREIALKLLRHELSSDADFVERFHREARTLAKLNHPNIASVHALLERSNALFMVMEYVSGSSLHHVLRSQGALAMHQALKIFQQMLSGIGYAHRRGVVHRDIKPANVMLTSDNTVKILDFGIAHVLGAAHLTLTGHIGGTAAYMSPEQIRGEDVDARTDIYSLGILLYMLLTGHPPFSGKSAYELMKSQVECAPPPLRAFSTEVPEHLETAVMRALRKRPCDRFQSTEEFALALGQEVSELCPFNADVASDAQPGGMGEIGASAGSMPTVEIAHERGASATRVAAPNEKPSAPWRQPAPVEPEEASRQGWLGDVLNRLQTRYDGRDAIVLTTLAFALLGMAALPGLVEDERPAAAPIERQATALRRPSPESPKDQLAAGGAVSASESGYESSRQDASAPLATHGKGVENRSLSILRVGTDTPNTMKANNEFGESSTRGARAAAYRFKRGELIDLMVKPSHDAYVYCYLFDEAQKIRRFYPNRFRPHALVQASTPLRIPGNMRFQLVANERGTNETVACFATPRDVMHGLPDTVVGRDFDALPVSSLEQIERAFTRVAGTTFAQGYFHVEVD